MDNGEQIKLIMTHLLGRPVSQADLEAAVAQVATDPQLLALFERLEMLLEGADDLAWLESIVAAREGLVDETMAAYLAERETLARLMPELVAQVEALLAESAAEAEEAPLLPPFPTFADRFETGDKPDDSTGWQQRPTFEWRLREAGTVVVRLLSALVSPPPLLATAVKGEADPEATLEELHRLSLDPDDTGDLALEIIIHRDPTAPALSRLTVRAESPSRWPDLAGVQVQATAADWQAVGPTDDDGEVMFEGLPVADIKRLVIEVTP